MQTANMTPLPLTLLLVYFVLGMETRIHVGFFVEYYVILALCPILKILLGFGNPLKNTDLHKCRCLPSING